MGAVYVFPGQGSQSVGMARNIYNKYPSSREVFTKANRILGYDLTSLMFNGPEEELRKTIYCQPAILISNLAYFNVLNKKIPTCLNLGHSVGEYSTLVASGALSEQDAIKSVRIRAQLMQKCVPKEEILPGTSHMAAIIKYPEYKINEVCDKISKPGNIVQIANVNAEDQIIISGNNAAVVEAVEVLKKNGAMVKYLNVGGPFHSELMKPASEGMKKALEDIVIKIPEIPYIANVSAESTYNPFQIKKWLVEQISNPVKWRSSLELAIDRGYPIFIECGYGNVQTKLLKRLKEKFPQIQVLDPEDFL